MFSKRSDIRLENDVLLLHHHKLWSVGILGGSLFHQFLGDAYRINYNRWLMKELHVNDVA